MPARRKAPRLLKCGNPKCGQLIDPAAWLVTPTQGTPPGQIHRIIDPAQSEGMFACYACGHFTEYRRAQVE